MLDRVIGAFNHLNLDLDDRDMADILWLAMQMRSADPAPLSELPQQTPVTTPEIESISPEIERDRQNNSPKSPTKTETSADVYPQSSQENQTASGLPIKVSTAQALRNKLYISRSLKPLKRRVADRNEFVLDEIATAESIAENWTVNKQLFLPVMCPAPARWLEVVLVIDESASMFLWQQTIKEFQQLLERHGAFRDVRTWGLFSDRDNKVWLRPRSGKLSHQKKLHNPKELIDPNGRRLFVIISDCVSPAWYNGAISKTLAMWASTSPTTILQVLPEWLWERSALGVAESILLRSLVPGVANQQLIMTALDLFDEIDVCNRLKIPVVTLEPESLKNWARMVAGAGDVQTKGFLLATDGEIFDSSSESTENPTVELTAKQRLQRFRLTASPMARKLAGLLAAAPVSLPVVRLIQQTMLQKSSQVHVAEVFLGGILKPLSAITEDGEADKIQFDFADGVRDLLLDGVPLTESTEVLRRVSEYVAARVGLSVDEFTAMLVNPGLVDGSSGVLVRPFAQITAKVLKRLGGKYAKLGEEIEQNLVSYSSTISQQVNIPILNLEAFYQACNPSRPLDIANTNGRQYYIDFDSVRGGKIIGTLLRTITNISPDTPTCQLFTGHIGSGKSTELLRLKAELEQQEFHVIYFKSTDVLELIDLDITDILLAIASQVSESLEIMKIRVEPAYFRTLFTDIISFLETPLDLAVEGELSVGIAKITAKTKESRNFRRRSREYLLPRSENILQSINQELLAPAIKKLKNQGKRGLVIIVDNLDRVNTHTLPSGRSLSESLFIDRGEQLSQLKCHLVYTIPLALTFSNLLQLQQRLGGGIAPKMLPMIPVRNRNGEIFQTGLTLMRKMILFRAFPGIHSVEKQELITQVFDSQETLDRLCLISGGHLHVALGLLFDCLREQDPPFDRKLMEKIIHNHQNTQTLSIDAPKWDLIFQVVREQKVRNHIEYHTLLHSLFVFEYRDRDGAWFAVNPILAETPKFQSWLEQQNTS